MLREFLTWWVRQLAGLLPAGWREADSGAQARDAVELNLLEPAAARPPVAELTLRRASLGRFTLDPAGLQALRGAVGAARRGAVRLGVPPRLFLEQSVSLPLAAERELESVLRYEMDRLTPFSADAVHWGWEIERRDRQRGSLQLRLLLVPKATVGAALEALGSAGLVPAFLVPAGSPGRGIALSRPRAGWWQARGPALLGGLCAVLALAAVAIPFVRQFQQAGRLDEQIATLRPQVDEAEALRRRLQERAGNADVMAAEGARLGDALQVLADVTDLLPDDTYLYELALRDRVLTLSGQSASAARLIPILAADPALRSPAFAAPVTRNEVSGAESFSIRAETVR